jgi:hypothetical protein
VAHIVANHRLGAGKFTFAGHGLAPIGVNNLEGASLQGRAPSCQLHASGISAVLRLREIFAVILLECKPPLNEA